MIYHITLSKTITSPIDMHHDHIYKKLVVSIKIQNLKTKKYEIW
jgi:hypothetical protein